MERVDEDTTLSKYVEDLIRRDAYVWRMARWMMKRKKSGRRNRMKLSELIGKRIVCIRPMNQKEKDAEGWEGSGCTAVIELEGGIKIYPSRDDEGNDGGTMFGKTAKGACFYVWPFDQKEVR